MRPAATVFREEQCFDWKVYALIPAFELLVGGGLIWITPNGGGLATFLGSPWSLQFFLAILTGLALPVVLAIFLLRMTTEVTPSRVRIWFGWTPAYPREVMIDNIRKVSVVRFRPIREHGGWGIRQGPDGERVLTARGDQGVRLELEDGNRLLIGSQRPQELADSIRRAMQPLIA